MTAVASISSTSLQESTNVNEPLGEVHDFEVLELPVRGDVGQLQNTMCDLPCNRIATRAGNAKGWKTVGGRNKIRGRKGKDSQRGAKTSGAESTTPATLGSCPALLPNLRAWEGGIPYIKGILNNRPFVQTVASDQEGHGRLGFQRQHATRHTL